MEVGLVFLAVMLAFIAATLVQVRYGFLLLLFAYGLYPKLLSLGVGEQGFALSAQRAMLYVLLGLYLVRALWGSADVRHGMRVMARNRAIVFGLVVYLAARLVGNALSGRMDVGAVAGLVNEFIVSYFTVLLVLTYVRSRKDILVVLGVVVASLLLNQLVGVWEFATGQSLFADTINVQYANESESKLLEGSVRSGFFRARGFFDNPLKLAGFLCLAVPFAIALLRASRAYFAKLLAATSLVLAPATAVMTGSRTAVAVLLLIALWYVYASVRNRFGRFGSNVLNLAAAVAAVGLIAMVATGVADSLFFGSEYARSTESRFLQFVRVPLALAESPLFGFGFARNIIDMLDIGHVDSFFLHTALEGGLVALAAVLFVMYQSARLLGAATRVATDAVTRRIARHLSVSAGFAFLLGLVLSLSDIRFYLFLLVGIAMVTWNLCHEEQDAASS